MKFDRSNKFDLFYYEQVNLLRLKMSVTSKWEENTFGGNIYFAGDGTCDFTQPTNEILLILKMWFQKADIALAPLSVMAERENVVDFTVPYYDLVGITIMMKKPKVWTASSQTIPSDLNFQWWKLSLDASTKGKKGKQSNSKYDVVLSSDGARSLTWVRLLSPFLQHERSKQSNFSKTTFSILIVGEELVI